MFILHLDHSPCSLETAKRALSFKNDHCKLNLFWAWPLAKKFGAVWLAVQNSSANQHVQNKQSINLGIKICLGIGRAQRGNLLYVFFKKWPITASFVYFRPFLITISIIQIEKSIDNVLRIWTCSRRMVGADKTTELWRPPNLLYVFPLDGWMHSRAKRSLQLLPNLEVEDDCIFAIVWGRRRRRHFLFNQIRISHIQVINVINILRWVARRGPGAGGHHISVDSPVPTILQPWVRIPSTPCTL